MKSSPLKIILSLITVVALVLLGGAIWVIQKYYPFKPSIERDGGTILVYELDEETLPAGYQPTEMAEAIRRRVDPTKSQNVSVHPDGDRRMEIRIPRGGDQEQRVEQIKEMLGLVGDLEFRILANEEDDGAAFEATKRFFAESKNDPRVSKILEQANATGQPPPAPSVPEKKGFVTEKGIFTYSWVELGIAYRRELGFEREKAKHRSTLIAPSRKWEEAADARSKNEPFRQGDRGALLYSREIAPNRIEPIEDRIQVEYFVLTRDLEDGMDNPGKYLDEASEDPDLTIRFHLTDKGGDLMRDLTGRNIERQMAVLLDGKVMSAARIQSKIGPAGQIAGHFTNDQVARMVAILRGGSLPAKLKPRPVSEIEVERQKGR